MRCSHCGAEIPILAGKTEGMRFCSSCGAVLDMSAADTRQEYMTAQRRSAAPNPNLRGDLGPAVMLGSSGASKSSAPRSAVTKTAPVLPRSTEPIYEPKPAPKKKSRLPLVLVLAVIFVPVILIMLNSNKTKEFSYEELRITLTNDFKERDAMTDLQHIDFTKAHVDYTLDGTTKSVFIYRDEKSTDSFASLSDYALYTMGCYPNTESETFQSRHGYHYFYATGEVDGSDTPSKVLVAMYESDDAFWTIEISMYETQFDESDAFEWADSVTFVE